MQSALIRTAMVLALLSPSLAHAAEPVLPESAPVAVAPAPAVDAAPVCSAYPPSCFGRTCPGPFVPIMFGDLLLVQRTTIGTHTLAPDAFVTLARQAGDIASSRGAFKIAENESPRPQDRVFFNYNYYNNVIGNLEEVNRATIGVEKTILGGNASVGIRLPFYHFQREIDVPAFDDTVAGDISLLFKAAIINTEDRILSVGLVLTTPTSPDASFILYNGEEVHDTLLQPFVGYGWSGDGWFVHGFSSLLIPTDSADVTVLFNDIGVGYRIARSGTLQEVVPCVELHVNTPLTHRSPTDLSHFHDAVDLTAGVHLVFSRAVFGLAAGTPVTSPRPYDFEIIASLNWRF